MNGAESEMHDVSRSEHTSNQTYIYEGSRTRPRVMMMVLHFICAFIVLTDACME